MKNFGKNEMPTAFTHAAVALAANIALPSQNRRPRLAALAVVCAVVPDLDILGFFFGLPYGHLLAHRGFFHSPFFNFVVAFAIMGAYFRDVKTCSPRWFRLFLHLLFVGASHGLLDALTNGGLGVAFLAPFDSTRFFLPWTPIPVSPIRVRSFLSPWGWEVLKSELLWVWVPCFSAAWLARMVRGLPPKEFGRV
jgi:inner membrane protein